MDLNVNLDSLQAEYNKLKATHTELAGQLAAAKGGIAADEGYSLLGQQSPHAGAVRGREKARTEALRHGEDEVSARAEQPSAGAENPATEKTEYGTVRHLPFSL